MDSQHVPKLKLPATTLVYFVCSHADQDRLIITDEHPPFENEEYCEFYLSSKEAHRVGRALATGMNSKQRVVEYQLRAPVQLLDASHLEFPAYSLPKMSKSKAPQQQPASMDVKDSDKSSSGEISLSQEVLAALAKASIDNKTGKPRPIDADALPDALTQPEAPKQDLALQPSQPANKTQFVQTQQLKSTAEAEELDGWQEKLVVNLPPKKASNSNSNNSSNSNGSPSSSGTNTARVKRIWLREAAGKVKLVDDDKREGVQQRLLTDMFQRLSVRESKKAGAGEAKQDRKA